MTDMQAWFARSGLQKALEASQKAGLDSPSMLAGLQSDTEAWATFCENAGLTLREAKRLEKALSRVGSSELHMWLVHRGLTKVVAATQKAGMKSPMELIKLQSNEDQWLNFCEDTHLSIREVKTLEKALEEWSAVLSLAKVAARLETEREELREERDKLRQHVARSAGQPVELAAQLEAEQQASARANAQVAKLLKLVGGLKGQVDSSRRRGSSTPPLEPTLSPRAALRQDGHVGTDIMMTTGSMTSVGHTGARWRLLSVAESCGHSDDDAASAVEQLLQAVDTDDDGVISLEEWSSAFRRIDCNCDRTITRKEWQLNQGSTTFFDMTKKRQSHVLTEAEWSDAYSAFGLSQQIQESMGGDFQLCLRLLSSLKPQWLEALGRKMLEAGPATSMDIKLGTKVAVLTQFQSESAEEFPRSLVKVGEQGEVSRVHTAGHAIIAFASGKKQVARSNFENLQVCHRVEPEIMQELLEEAYKLVQVLNRATISALSAVSCLSVVAVPALCNSYLRRLDDIIPLPPDCKDWQASEIPKMLQEYFPDDIESQKRYSPDPFSKNYNRFVANVAKETGMVLKDATLLSLLTTVPFVMPMARALRARDSCYAGATHELSSLAAKALQTKGGAVAPRLYAPLHGLAGLVSRDPAWGYLEEPDITGLRDVVSTAAVKASRNTCNVQEHGYLFHIGSHQEFQDGPLVCFESEDPDEQGGLHSAVMIGSDSGIFPLNTLFRLKAIQEAPFLAEVVTLLVGGAIERKTVQVKQRCFMVRATFQKPRLHMVA